MSDAERHLDAQTASAAVDLDETQLDGIAGGDGTTTTTTQSSGSGAGKITFNPFSITRHID
jgi:hypothetical protein